MDIGISIIIGLLFLGICVVAGLTISAILGKHE